MFTVTKALIATLATIGAVNALPQVQPKPSTNATAPTVPAPTEDQAQLFRDLFSAPTAIKRFQRLLTEGQTLLTGAALKKFTVFDFNGAMPATGAKGGATKSANVETFPILYDLGISTTLGFLEPCGINTPHVHPRATEFLTLVDGENLAFGYVLENGLVKAGQSPEIAGALKKFEGTVFPKGSIHYQFNDNCEKAIFVASLSSEDPGTSQVAQGFFALNSGVVNATLGFPTNIDGRNIEQFREVIPANLAQDVDVCLARCKTQNEYKI